MAEMVIGGFKFVSQLKIYQKNIKFISALKTWQDNDCQVIIGLKFASKLKILSGNCPMVYRVLLTYRMCLHSLDNAILYGLQLGNVPVKVVSQLGLTVISL